MNYHELSPKAKERALQEFIISQPDWYLQEECERAKEDGKARGFQIEHVYYSGFASQGDGACWVGHIDVYAWLELHPDPTRFIMGELFREGAFTRLVSVSQHGQYYHEHTMCIDEIEPYGQGEHILTGILAGADMDELRSTVEPEELFKLNGEMLEDARNFARETYKRLEAEWEYQSSEEAILEAAEANGWSWDKFGNVVYDVCAVNKEANSTAL